VEKGEWKSFTPPPGLHLGKCSQRHADWLGIDHIYIYRYRYVGFPTPP